jgi:hypothetical protein
MSAWTFILNASPVVWLIIAAPFVLSMLARGAAEYVEDRFETSRLRPVRLWYGPGCRVQPRGYGLVHPAYKVTEWDGNTGGPVWVKVIPAPRGGESGDPMWVPLTALRPFEVPYFSPSLRRLSLTRCRHAPGADAA